MQILIVDDREENRYLMEVMFKGAGHEVRSAVNGAEALEWLETGPFDLIVSDILMPIMDGFQLCQRVRADERLRHIPFIIYTATYTGPQDEEFARKIGADRFIVKPCEPVVFMETIREVLTASEQGGLAYPPGPSNEEDVLKLYNERLVRKLEQKMMQLEKEVNARRETEIALRESDEKHRRLFETMLQGVIYMDRDGKIFDANPAAESILGLTKAQLHGRVSSDQRWGAVHEDGSDFPGETHPVAVALRTGQSVENVIMGVSNPREDSRRWIIIDAIPLFRPGEDQPYQVYATFDDITEHKRSEEENVRLQAQFQQAQKMESVGRLAGGIAHDFNNLLSVILGYTEFAIKEIRHDDPLRDGLLEVREAGERAAALTKQLLAFSRKLVLNPRVLDLNLVIGNLEKMLSRLIGEDIDIQLSLAPNLWKVKVDPGQLEMAIMNLAINARDAMPGGGKLIIETHNAEFEEGFDTRHVALPAGSYVVLAVGDTGCGMDAATRERLFEPFYTTKEQGKGTGLGLSTVYGIVKQSGGGIEVFSELGHGATFKVYLPRSIEENELTATDRAARNPAIGNETILIVEDEDAVRKVAERMLRVAGYSVLTAMDGAEALLLCERHPGEIHLLLSDLVMPRMSGPLLAEQLLNLRPRLRVLYMSGYSNTNSDQHGALRAGARFIGKPFNYADLTHQVREALDSEPQAGKEIAQETADHGVGGQESHTFSVNGEKKGK